MRSPLALSHWCFLDERSFRRQIGYLKRHFDVIALSEAVHRLQDASLVHPTAAITFDDGFANTYDVARPILDAAELPATVFLTTGLVGSDDTLWFCRLNDALAGTTTDFFEWDGCRFDVDGPARKARAASCIQNRLKQLSHPRLLTDLHGILELLGTDPHNAIGVGSPFRMLSERSVREMSASGRFEFGAHTHSHAILSRLAPAERRHEIERSVSVVTELTGRPCELFAYPNGRAEDYDDESIRMLEACGIRAAVTAISGINDRTTPMLELRRYGVGARATISEFKLGVRRPDRELEV